MIRQLLSLGEWNWFIVAAVFLVLELIIPGTFMMWLGIAAILVGLISLAIDWTWQLQLIAFAVLSLASIPLWRRFARGVEPASDHPLLNRRTQGYVGRVFTLETPIVNNIGTIRIDDTVWRVTGPDCAAGERVRVVEADGANLRVEPAN